MPAYREQQVHQVSETVRSMEYHIMVFQTFCKHFALPAISRNQEFFWILNMPPVTSEDRVCGLSSERNAVHHLQVITGQTCIFQRRAQVPQFADAEVLQDLRAGPDFRIDP